MDVEDEETIKNDSEEKSETIKESGGARTVVRDPNNVAMRYSAVRANSLAETVSEPSSSGSEIESKGSEDQNEKVREIPEPESSNPRTGSGISEDLLENKDLEIPEPVSLVSEPLQLVSEPDDLGSEIDTTEALDVERRLWAYEAYGDRHGKRRLRKYVRFVHPTERIELGTITTENESKLRQRPGRGRWKASRDDADALRCLAQSIAERVRGDKRRRRESKNVSKTGRAGDFARRDQSVSAASDTASGEVSDMSVKWPKYIP